MPNLVAISQATAKINRGAESAPPGIECFKSPRSDSVKQEVIGVGLCRNATEIRLLFFRKVSSSNG